MNKLAACNSRAIIFFFICLPFLVFIFSPANADMDQTYSFGLLPQGAALGMYKRWSPVIEKISESTGIKLNIKVFDHVSEFENELMEGFFDFVYLHSTQAAQAYIHQKYIPLIRSERYCKGAIFVAKDSNVRKIEDLKGKAIALVSQKSICAIILKHALKNNEKIENLNIIYGGSATNVYKNVLLNKAVAGGTLDAALNKESGEGFSKLRLIYETPPMAPHPIAAHPRIPEKIRTMVKEAMMRLSQDGDKAKMLNQVRMPPPLVFADYNKDYKALEKYVIE